VLYRHQKKNDEPRDMVRILSEMEKCTSNINFDGWPFDHWKDQRESDTSYHKAKSDRKIEIVDFSEQDLLYQPDTNIDQIIESQLLRNVMCNHYLA
jgi:hypothetical protein